MNTATMTDAALHFTIRDCAEAEKSLRTINSPEAQAKCSQYIDTMLDCESELARRRRGAR